MGSSPKHRSRSTQRAPKRAEIIPVYPDRKFQDVPSKVENPDRAKLGYFRTLELVFEIELYLLRHKYRL